MPEVKFCGKSGTVVRLKEDPNLVVVRTRSRRSCAKVRSRDRRRKSLKTWTSSQPSRMPGSRCTAGRRRRPAAPAGLRTSLKSFEDVRFAGRGLVNEMSGEPVVYTENLFVKFKDDIEPEECCKIVSEHGLTIKASLTYATNAYFVGPRRHRADGVRDRRTAAEAGRGGALPSRADSARGVRAVFAQQWHLKKTTIGGVAIDASANVEAAHGAHARGRSHIAIIDNGVDIDHAELASPARSWRPARLSPGRSTTIPRPGSGQHHGTACAGVACAEGRNGASGVAPRGEADADPRSPRASARSGRRMPSSGRPTTAPT